jgi:hypothetical protein
MLVCKVKISIICNNAWKTDRNSITLSSEYKKYSFQKIKPFSHVHHKKDF